MMGQGGYQIQHEQHGLEQARAAIEVAMGNTVQGDLDWMTPGWADAVALATQDAEELLEEAGQLDYVHPADVVALQDGAEEAPAEPEGDFDTTESTCSCEISGQWHTSFTLGGNHCDS